MSIKVVWEHYRHGISIIKHKKLNGKIKYHIWDNAGNGELSLLSKDMLDMCQAVIDDAKESESE